ncbi:UDP-glucose 4-epimerase [Stenotrophomonas phage vB_SmaS_DLP_3]|nr:UDP-glucose 4-epimerase [Stenotrophomonas phage vB_SmaS_DLP_3]
MRILVTGGCGYIGKNVVMQLHRAGHSVIIVDDLTNAPMGPQWKDFLHKNKSHGSQHPGSVDLIPMGFEQLPGLDGMGIQCVIHLAACKSVIESKTDPDKYWTNNVINTIKLARAARAAGVELFVYSSTASVYGEKDTPVVEGDITNPLSTYGQTKLAAEEYLASISLVSGMKVRALRYFNVVGAGHSPWGSNTLGDKGRDAGSTLFGKIIRQHPPVLTDLVIRGKNHPTLDGFAVRDYVHVEDLAAAHVAILHREFGDSPWPSQYVVMNVGTGIGYSVVEVLNEFGAQGFTVPYTVGPADSTEIPYSVCDPRKLQGMYGWEAQHDLMHMVGSMLEFAPTLADLQSIA